MPQSNRAGQPYWKVDEVGFFNLDLSDDSAIGIGDIIYISHNIYFYNIHVFIDRVKNIIYTKSEVVIQLNLYSCLYSTTLEWYTSKLIDFKKDLLQILLF